MRNTAPSIESSGSNTKSFWSPCASNLLVYKKVVSLVPYFIMVLDVHRFGTHRTGLYDLGIHIMPNRFFTYCNQFMQCYVCIFLLDVGLGIIVFIEMARIDLVVMV